MQFLSEIRLFPHQFFLEKFSFDQKPKNFLLQYQTLSNSVTKSLLMVENQRKTRYEKSLVLRQFFPSE